MEKGADVNATNSMGLTAVYGSCQRGSGRHHTFLVGKRRPGSMERRACRAGRRVLGEGVFLPRRRGAKNHPQTQHGCASSEVDGENSVTPIAKSQRHQVTKKFGNEGLTLVPNFFVPLCLVVSLSYALLTATVSNAQAVIPHSSTAIGCPNDKVFLFFFSCFFKTPAHARPDGHRAMLAQSAEETGRKVVRKLRTRHDASTAARAVRTGPTSMLSRQTRRTRLDRAAQPGRSRNHCLHRLNRLLNTPRRYEDLLACRCDSKTLLRAPMSGRRC